MSTQNIIVISYGLTFRPDLLLPLASADPALESRRNPCLGEVKKQKLEVELPQMLLGCTADKIRDGPT